jgi:KDO2-lipid IV(A) lauroyltransferase
MEASPVKESILRDLLRLVVWYPIRWMVLCLPLEPAIGALYRMGDCHFLLGRGKKRIIADNLTRLSQVDSIGNPRRCLLQYFRNYYLDRLFIWLFPRFNRENIMNFIEISGRHRIDHALQSGRGVVLVHGHFGPVHLPLVALSILGYPMKQVGNLSDEGLSWIGRHVSFNLRKKYEDQIPAEIFKAGSYLRPILRWLKDGGVLMITGDGTGTNKAIGRQASVTFQGQPVEFPIGPYLLAQKTDAVVLPMFVVPGKKKRFRIEIDPPLAPDNTPDTGHLRMAAQFADKLTGRVRQNPGYMHFIDRFHPGGVISADEML